MSTSTPKLSLTKPATSDGVALLRQAIGHNADVLDEAAITGTTAGGVLSGTFPNPGFAVDMATQAELDAVIAKLPVSVLAAATVLEPGLVGQRRAGRVLTVADFTTLMGLSTPVGLFNLGGLTNLGSGGALSNKGSVPFTTGILGAATEAALFAGSTGQALYIADTGASDPFRIRTGSWGCWFRTAKRGVAQTLLCKWGGSAGLQNWDLRAGSGNVLEVLANPTGSSLLSVAGITDICDDRWHFAVATYDGACARLYLDGVLEASGAMFGPLGVAAAPLNVGAEQADGSTAAVNPHFGRIDEAFVAADVLGEDQVRMLYASKVAHGFGSAPNVVTLNVRRLRKGANWVNGDFPTAPKHRYDGGSLTDGGSLANNLTANNTPTKASGPDGAFNGAYIFVAGLTQYLSVTDTGLPTSGARSISAWFKSIGAAGASYVIAAYGSLTGGQGIAVAIGSAGLITLTDASSAVAGPWVVDGAWHHVVATQDASAADGVKWKLHLDGRLVASSTATVGTVSLAGANGLRIGRDRGAGTNYFDGSIGPVAITDYALSGEQVAALHAKGGLPLPASPKDAGTHVEGIDATNLYVIADGLESQHTIDLRVAS